MENLKQIFEKYYDFDSHMLSHEARWKANLSYEADRHFVYWEVSEDFLQTIFSLKYFEWKKYFLDLGAWTWKAIVWANYLKNLNSTWIEYFSNLVQKWNETIEKIKKDNILKNECKILTWDFFDFNWSKYDIVFAHSTCFHENTIIKIAQKSTECKIWTIFISVSHPLKTKNLKLLEEKNILMWRGEATVFIYEKI